MGHESRLDPELIDIPLELALYIFGYHVRSGNQPYFKSGKYLWFLFDSIWIRNPNHNVWEN